METTSIELFGQVIDLRQQTRIINNAIIAITEGGVNPLKAEIILKAYEEIIKGIRGTQVVKDVIRKESEKFGKSFNYMGAEITNATRTTYDYSVCRDEIYNDLVKQKAQLDEQIKIREKMLQTGCNIETGETFTKPIPQTTEYLKIVFKKD